MVFNSLFDNINLGAALYTKRYVKFLQAMSKTIPLRNKACMHRRKPVKSPTRAFSRILRKPETPTGFTDSIIHFSTNPRKLGTENVVENALCKSGNGTI